MNWEEIYKKYASMTNEEMVKHWKSHREISNDEHISDLMMHIETDNPSVIGVDTETTGLDQNKDRPFNIIVGWYDNTNTYKGFVFGFNSLYFGGAKTQFTEKEIENTRKLLNILDTKPIVLHNAKYDIGMLQNVVKDWIPNPDRVMDTITMAKHIDPDIEDKPSMALKSLVDSYYIRSTLPELEELKLNYRNSRTPQAKAAIIIEALEKGNLPVSKRLLYNIDVLNKGEDSEYFTNLLYKPEALIKEGIVAQTKQIEDKFVEMFPEWKMTLNETYKHLVDVYSSGEEWFQTRQVLRKFNTEVLGFKDEWAQLFKTSTQYNYPSYLEILREDPAALLVYANMDVKITLDLYNHLLKLAKDTGFDADGVKVMKQDIHAIRPVLLQEKTGLYLDQQYVLESIDRAKVALREINDGIINRLEFIVSSSEIQTPWREALSIEAEDDLKATNYEKYVTFFKTYTPWFQLPISENRKTTVKIDTISKLAKMYAIFKSDDEELINKIRKLNEGVIQFQTLFGDTNTPDYLVKNVVKMLLTEGQRVVNERLAEIEVKKAEGKNLKLRKAENEILHVLQNYQSMSMVEIMMELKTHLGTIVNKFIKSQDINIYKAQRTINKNNIQEVLKIDLDTWKDEQIAKGVNVTNRELAIAQEIISIVKDKQTEASILKWIGVYMIKLLAQYSVSADDRIRTSFMISGPVTGRLSGDIQQFPKKPLKNVRTGEVIYHPRKAFKVMPTSDINEPVVYAFLDFSQIELRGAAEYTMQWGMPDVPFIRAYIPYNCYSKELGLHKVKEHKKIWKQYQWYTDMEMTQKWEPTDLHAVPVNAAFPHLANIDISENSTDDPKLIAQKSAYRGAAKGINFGILYGSGLNGILGNAGLADFDEQALTDIFNAQKQSYVNVANWQKAVGKQVRLTGAAKNIQGRTYRQGFKREMNQFGTMEFSNSYKATNYLIQGEAAGVLKQCMIRVQKYIDENNLKSKMLTNIHDEIGYIVPLSEIGHIIEFQRIMQDIEWWDIDVISDMEIAITDWSEKIGVVTKEDMMKHIMEQQDVLKAQAR